MRRVTAGLLALILILCLTACKGKNGGTASPVDLVSPTPHMTHVGTDTVEAGNEYRDKLCSYPWLDTYDMTYYRFSNDGSYQHFIDKALTESIDSGTWTLLKDAENYLELHLTGQDGATYDLFELELYDQSFYAHSREGSAYIWLMGDSAE